MSSVTATLVEASQSYAPGAGLRRAGENAGLPTPRGRRRWHACRVSGDDDWSLVDALRDLPGVDAATAADEGGVGLALDVHLSAGADEVAVATAVTRLLREHFGLVVGSDRVQVLSPAHLQFRPAPGQARDRFHGEQVGVPRPRQGRAARNRRDDGVRSDRAVVELVEVDTNDEDATATVRLGSRSGPHVGRVVVDLPAAEAAVLPAVAAAALEALESFTGQRAKFTVEHVDVSDAGGHRTVLAVVTMRSDQVAHLCLPGVALVRGDVHDAVVRATLAAVNRQVERLLVD